MRLLGTSWSTRSWRSPSRRTSRRWASSATNITCRFSRASCLEQPWGGPSRAALLFWGTGADKMPMPLDGGMTDQRRFAVVILAAGQGTRMRSDTHKVLHPIASRPLLLHLLDRVDALGADKRVVVVGKGREQVEAAIAGRDVAIALQADQQGTGHAVQQAAKVLG